MRGLVVGGTLGALVSYGWRTFSVSSEVLLDQDDAQIAPLLSSNPLLSACFHRLSELKAASPSAKDQFQRMLGLCNDLMRAERGMRSEKPRSQFHLNRDVAEFKRSLKTLCAIAGENRQYVDASRTLLATEKQVMDEFCDRFLHNMVLGR